ncbi:MAG: prolyl oligopeptidase family serine peptidase [Bacteroidota bacterium]
MKKYTLLITILFPVISILTAQENVPVELLFKDNIYSTYRLSPDGDYFTTIKEHNVGYEIMVIDLHELYIYQSIPIGKTSIDNISWIDSRRLLYEQEGRLYTINIDGTDNSLLLNNWTDDAPKIVYESNYKKYFQYSRLLSNLWEDKEYILVESTNLKGIASIYKINLFTGDKELIETGKNHKINSWVANRNGDPILGLRYNKKDKIELLSKNESGIWEDSHISIDGSEYQLIVEGKSYLNNLLTLNGAGYGNSVYLGSTVSSDKRKLIEYSFDDSKSTTILELENFDLGDVSSNISQLLFNDKEDELIGVRYHSDKPTTTWFTSDLQEFHEELEKKYPDFNYDVIDINYDASVFLIHIWHPTYQGRIGLVRKDSAEIISLLILNEDIEIYNFPDTEIIYPVTRDGRSLLGYLNIPINSPFKQIPLVVIPHGGPWAREYYYFEPFSQFFASRGYATLRLNFRGSTGFGQEFLLSGIKSIHTIMIDDIYDGARYCIKDFNLDTSNIYIYGHSYGGYAAVMSAVRYPEFYNAIVSVSAPYDIYDWMKLLKKEDNSFAYEMWETAIGNHKEDQEFIKKISPINNVEKIEIPILLFHGEEDYTIPCEQAYEFEKSLKQAGVDYDLKVIQDEGHSLQNGNNSGYILLKSEEFFRKSMNKQD